MGIETLMLASSIASAASSAMKGVNALQMAKYQSRVLRAEGQQARLDAGTEVQAGLERSARLTGQGIVAAATSGGGGGGSALDVLQDLSRQSFSEARRVATEGQAAGRAADAQAKVVRKQGRVAFATSMLEAGSTLLSSAMGAKQASAQSSAMQFVGQQQAVNRAPSGFSLEGLY